MTPPPHDRGGDMCSEQVGEHIARCSPSNMRTLIAAYRALERERDEATARVRQLEVDLYGPGNEDDL